MSKQESLNQLFNQPEWKDLIEVERQFRDDNLLAVMNLSEDDPAFERKIIKYKAYAQAVSILWSLRDRIRKNGESVKKQKGE